MIAGNNKLVFLLAFRVLANDQNVAEKDQQKPQEITKLFRYGIYVLACFEQSL